MNKKEFEGDLVKITYIAPNMMQTYELRGLCNFRSAENGYTVYAKFMQHGSTYALELKEKEGAAIEWKDFVSDFKYDKDIREFCHLLLDPEELSDTEKK